MENALAQEGKASLDKRASSTSFAKQAEERRDLAQGLTCWTFYPAHATVQQPRRLDLYDVVQLLRMLLRKITGPLLVIWDGLPIQRAEVVKQFLSRPMGKRLHLERLPGSAPRVESARIGVEPAQAPRAQACVLSGPRACQGTPSPSAGTPSTLLCSCS